MVQGLSQEPVSIQRHNSGECHPTMAADEEDEALRKEGSDQDPLPEVPWEGWGLIKTPDGFYLPETFNPFPRTIEPALGPVGFHDEELSSAYTSLTPPAPVHRRAVRGSRLPRALPPSL